MLIPLPRLAVQHECIPQAILGMDVICQAKSGMGKTAVFVLAVLQQLEPVPGEIGAPRRPGAGFTRDDAFPQASVLASYGGS